MLIESKKKNFLKKVATTLLHVAWEISDITKIKFLCCYFEKNNCKLMENL